MRDSYGALLPLTKVRDAIARGDAVGARILAAGNILGWSGPYSFSFSRVMGQLTLFQEQMNDFIAQGGGEELMAMTPDELRRAIDAYLDKGPDFLKFGGTSHFSEPTFIGFSAEAQQVIVEEAHTRGTAPPKRTRRASKGCGVSIAAGIDGIQHPELLDGREMPDDLVADDRRSRPELLDAREHHHRAGVEAASQDEGRSREEAAPKRRRKAESPAREKTTAERRKEARRRRRRSRDAADERAEADSRRLPRRRRAPTATGPRRPS